MILGVEQYLANTKNRAVRSLVTLLIGVLILLLLEILNADKRTKSYITWFIFWPLYAYSLYQALLVVKFYHKSRKSLSIFFLLMTFPSFAFLLYSIYKLVVD